MWARRVVGVLDTRPFVANDVGTTRGLVTVVSALGSLVGVVTVRVAREPSASGSPFASGSASPRCSRASHS